MSTSRTSPPQDRARPARDAWPAQHDASLLHRMLTRGWEFDFFQAVWLLERYLAAPALDVAPPDRKPVVPLGERGPVSEERVRLRPYISVGFPSTDVRRIMRRALPDNDEFFFRLEVTFMGLYGVSTPLPLHYAISILRAVESVPGLDPVPAGGMDSRSQPGSPAGMQACLPAARESPPQADRPAADMPPAAPAGDDNGESSPVRDFLDIFHHRLLSLFYRAWTKYRYDVTFGMPGRDVVTDYLLWLIGLSRGCRPEEIGLVPTRLIRYAGIFTQHPRSAATLEGLLLDYWGAQIPVEAHQFQGRWVALAPADLNRIGALNSRLGVDLTVGEEVYDLAGAFSISLGPVDWQTYLSFLPDGAGYAQTKALVELYCTDPLAFTIEVKIDPGQVPITRLTSDDQAGRLGFTSWIRTDEMGETSVTFDATRDTPARSATADRRGEAAPVG